MTKYDRIYALGDSHGSLMNIVNASDAEGLTENDLLIQLGDFGFFWRTEDKTSTSYLKNTDYTFAFIRGNHDNKGLIESNCTFIDKWGGKVGQIGANGKCIYYLSAGICVIDGLKVLVIPGASSIDKAYRTEGRSWWADETLSGDEQNKIFADLAKHNWKVDVVLAHTLPARYKDAFLPGPKADFTDPVEQFMDAIVEDIQFDRWIFGHYHMDHTDGKYTCSYNFAEKIKDNE